MRHEHKNILCVDGTSIVTRFKDIKMQERIMTLNNWKTTKKYTIRTYRFTIM